MPVLQTNGVTERYHGAIKNEALWRDLPADGTEMTRPWSTGSTPASNRTRRSPATGRYLAEPDQAPADDPSATASTIP